MAQRKGAGLIIEASWVQTLDSKLFFYDVLAAYPLFYNNQMGPHSDTGLSL